MVKTWLRRALVLGWIPTLLVVGGARWFDEPAAATWTRWQAAPTHSHRSRASHQRQQPPTTQVELT